MNNNYIAIDENGVVSMSLVDNLPEIGGTFSVGSLDVSYAQLVATFGEPNAEGDTYKSDAEWNILTPAGIATVYNYKDGHNYCGSDGLDIEDITDWHVGGRSSAVVDYLKKALNLE